MGGSGSKFSKANADLQNACKANDVEAAKKAIAAGAKVNEPSPQPPIIWAAWWNAAAVIEYLMDIEELEVDICSDLVKGGNGQCLPGSSPLPKCHPNCHPN